MWICIIRVTFYGFTMKGVSFHTLTHSMLEMVKELKNFLLLNFRTGSKFYYKLARHKLNLRKKNTLFRDNWILNVWCLMDIISLIISKKIFEMGGGRSQSARKFFQPETFVHTFPRYLWGKILQTTKFTKMCF